MISRDTNFLISKSGMGVVRVNLVTCTSMTVHECRYCIRVCCTVHSPHGASWGPVTRYSRCPVEVGAACQESACSPIATHPLPSLPHEKHSPCSHSTAYEKMINCQHTHTHTHKSTHARARARASACVCNKKAKAEMIWTCQKDGRSNISPKNVGLGIC